MRLAILTENRFGFTKEMIVADFEPIVRLPIRKEITLNLCEQPISYPIPVNVVEFEFVGEDNGVLHYREVVNK